MDAPKGRLRQPGPARPERWLAAGGALLEFDFTLEAGLTINAAIAGPLTRAGIRGAIVELTGGALGPFTYVRPAPSSDPRYAAFYSPPYTPHGSTAFDRGVATFGERDGDAFVHCHAVWQEPHGRGGGHVMPLDTIVREPIEAHVYGTADAAFRVLPDAETNFSLFTPVASCGAKEGRRVLLLKIQPNEHVQDAVLASCRAHGIQAASVHGIGSLVGARFADGRHVPSVATEIFLNRGHVHVGRDHSEIDITLVDVDGVIHAGRLCASNAVCITCELCVVESPFEGR